MNWRAWYDDGSVYNSGKHVWTDLPDDGLLVRMLYYDSGKQIQMGVDYYYEALHSSGEPILGCGMVKDEIENRYPEAVIKRGRWAPDRFYRKIVEAAHASIAP